MTCVSRPQWAITFLTLLAGSALALGDDRSTDDLLGAALSRATGLTLEELRLAAEDLLALPAPSQLDVWRERMQCNRGKCASEVGMRLLSTLGEAGMVPFRGFEPSKGDPLYKHWVQEDKKQEFHSWQTGAGVSDDESLAALVPEGQALGVGRIQAAHFIRMAKEHIVEISGWWSGAFGRCLEWDNPFYIVKAFGHLCTKFDVLLYANLKAGDEEELRTYPAGTRMLKLDVMQPPRWLPRDYGVVVCFFVLEHVPDPYLAMRGIARMLAPGGFLLLGAPFIDGVHGCPDDYLRYTPHGLRRIAEASGLEVLMQSSPGGPAMAAGEIVGMRSAYWRLEDLIRDSDTHPTNVFVLARRPPRDLLAGRNHTFEVS